MLLKTKKANFFFKVSHQVFCHTQLDDRERPSDSLADRSSVVVLVFALHLVATVGNLHFIFFFFSPEISQGPF